MSVRTHGSCSCTPACTPWCAPVAAAAPCRPQELCSGSSCILLQVVRHVSHGISAEGPALGRILLQTPGVENTGKFQEAVAEALASQLQARACFP